MKPLLLIFDVDTKSAKRKFGSKIWPYAKIEAFLSKHGFRREQGSAFANPSGMTPVDQANFLQALADELPWFGDIARNVKLVEIANDIGLSGNPRQYRLPF